MKKLEQIKNDYAVSERYNNFNDLLNGFLEYKCLETMNKHIENLLKEYAMECLKRASENVTDINNYSCSIGTLCLDEHRVEKSITNENNIIK